MREVNIRLLAVVVGIGLGACRAAPEPEPVPLPTAAPTPRPALAHVRAIKGTVSVKVLPELDWTAARSGMELRGGDMLKSDPSSAARLEFLDGFEVELGPSSLTTIEARPERERPVSLNVSSGGVEYGRSGKGTTGLTTRSFEWKGDAGSVKGSLRVGKDGASTFRQYEGSGSIRTSTGQTVAVGPKQQLAIHPDGVAEAARALPDPPALLSPAHESELAYSQPTSATTMLSWRAVAGARGYRVQVDREAWFANPLLDRSVKEASLGLPGLEEGKYYWRVAAEAEPAGLGGFSDFGRFTVVRGGTADAPPALYVEPLAARGNIVRVKGRTTPGGQVVIDGQRVEVQADGAFDEFLSFDAPGPKSVAVRATGRNGGVTTVERSLVLAPW